MNPNVMYELGIRHAFNHKTIHMVDKETVLPWDIDKNFAIKYDSPIQACDLDEIIKELIERDKILGKMDETKDSFSSFHHHVQSRANIENSNTPNEMKDILIKMQAQIDYIQSEMQMAKNTSLKMDQIVSLGAWEKMALTLEAPIGGDYSLRIPKILSELAETAERVTKRKTEPK